MQSSQGLYSRVAPSALHLQMSKLGTKNEKKVMKIKKKVLMLMVCLKAAVSLLIVLKLHLSSETETDQTEKLVRSPL